MHILQDGMKIWSGLSHVQAVVIGVVLCTASIGIGYLAWHHKIFKEGVEFCEGKQEGVNVAAKAQLDAANVIIEDKNRQIEDLRRQAKLNRPAAAKAAQDVINANPTFAILVRPEPLFAQRVRELQEIRRAAAGN